MNNKTRAIIGIIFLIIGLVLCFIYMGFSSSSFYSGIGSAALIYTILLIIPPVILIFSNNLSITNTVKIAMFVYVILVLLLSILRGVAFSDLPGAPLIIVYAILSLISVYLLETKSKE
ncbi:MAG: hypothetical protein IJQ68_09425 [Methanobrevibacter sp.]|uniref:hypothetical protein n=1 Tax=Methanobrevibacter sp. TaxID=66852 RepID=UPI0025D2D1F6|nr:hypothetical protein [Methanobrevibacter sp.]MBR0272187.1 hypothetical protein [Methanobrevibacter sp.]